MPVAEPLVKYAEAAAREILGGMPDVLRRSEIAAAQAQRAVRSLRRPRPELLVSAAWLYAVGEAPALRRCGLPSVDGATHLMDQGWPTPTASLVAHQQQSRMIARALGCEAALSLFDRVPGWPADIVDFAILTSSPQGPVELEEGLNLVRHFDIAHPRISASVREERTARLRRAGERVCRAITVAEEVTA
jgi:hypothetical protein